MNPLVGFFIAQAATPPAPEGSAEGSAEGASGIASLLGGANLSLIVGGVVLLLALYAIAKVVSAAGSMSKYGAGLPASVRRQVKTLQDSNNGRQAADLLFEHGAFADAADVYALAGDFLRAGEASERGGNTAKAVQYYRRGGSGGMAAEAYVRRGQFQLAAKEFEASEAPDKAAECYVKANDFRKAAELYEKLERYKEAGAQFERLNDHENAARLYRRHFDIQYDIARGDVRAIKDACELASKAAGFLEQLHRQPEAAELLRKAGFLRRAAEMYTSIGKIEEAAKIYVDARKPEYAARLYDSVGDNQKAIRFRAEAKLTAGDKRGAAEDFEAALEFLRAAELFVDVGERVRAGENYERAEDFRLAAEYYNLGEQRAKAAEMYEKAGDFDSAADLYRAEGDFRSELRVAKAGNDFYRVGEILLEHSRLEDALAAFQRVDNGDPRYDGGCILQGDILRKLGRLDVAFQKYKEAVGDQRPSKGNVDLMYKMAETAEEGGNLVQALQLFESVIGVDYYYRDANDRATAVRQKIGAQGSQAGFNMTGIGYAPNPAMVAAAAAPPQPAKQRRYEVLDEVARGGMGVVYRARDTVLDRVVAYKLLSANLKGNDVAVKYFLREARAAAQMAHVNIVTVFDAGEQDGEFFMAMEFVEGQTLKQLITRQGAFPEKLVRYIMAHVCRGLAYAHDRGLVHRDVKPGNIMLTRDRTVKIMDFGLAKFVEEVQAQHTRAIGTPYYMSPEQILGKELDGRSDLYSLGVSMFECATGQVPFSKGDLSYHHLHTEPPSVLELNPKIGEELAGIIHKCMAKSPDDRFKSAADLASFVKP